MHPAAVSLLHLLLLQLATHGAGICVGPLCVLPGLGDDLGSLLGGDTPDDPLLPVCGPLVNIVE